MKSTDSSNGKEIEFPKLLKAIQEFMPNAYSELLASSDNSQQHEFQFKSRIRKYLQDNRYFVKGYSDNELTESLYNEMARFSFLTKYLTFKVKGIEGIEIDSWDSVKIKRIGGDYKHSKEHFLSPKHAYNISKRILNESSGATVDEQHPIGVCSFGDNIRITMNTGGGTLDESTGIAMSIRFINPSNLAAADIIKSGTLTPEMLFELCTFYRYGCSMLLAGETDAGKTTLMSIIMKTSVPYDKKLITIEYRDREFNCVVRDKETNEILNSVIHMKTTKAINQQTLLELAMTMNPDFLCMAEIKGSEAFESVEAALTGHPVIGTIHAECCEDMPDRSAQLMAMKDTNLSDATMYKMIAKAFPILYYCQKGEDGVRRVTEICECCFENGKTEIHTLWEFVNSGSSIVNGKKIIEGHFKKVQPISDYLQKKLKRKQIPDDVLQNILSKKGEYDSDHDQFNILPHHDGRSIDFAENVAV